VKEVVNNVVDAVDNAKEKVYDKANDVYDNVQDSTKGSLEKGKKMGQTFKDHVDNVTETKDGVKKFVSLSMERVESLTNELNLLGICKWLWNLCLDHF
jgi:phage-related tail protein